MHNTTGRRVTMALIKWLEDTENYANLPPKLKGQRLHPGSRGHFLVHCNPTINLHNTTGRRVTMALIKWLEDTENYANLPPKLKGQCLHPRSRGHFLVHCNPTINLHNTTGRRVTMALIKWLEDTENYANLPPKLKGQRLHPRSRGHFLVHCNPTINLHNTTGRRVTMALIKWLEDTENYANLPPKLKGQRLHPRSRGHFLVHCNPTINLHNTTGRRATMALIKWLEDTENYANLPPKLKGQRLHPRSRGHFLVHCNPTINLHNTTGRRVTMALIKWLEDTENYANLPPKLKGQRLHPGSRGHFLVHCNPTINLHNTTGRRVTMALIKWLEDTENYANLPPKLKGQRLHPGSRGHFLVHCKRLMSICSWIE